MKKKLRKKRPAGCFAQLATEDKPAKAWLNTKGSKGRAGFVPLCTTRTSFYEAAPGGEAECREGTTQVMGKDACTAAGFALAGGGKLVAAKKLKKKCPQKGGCYLYGKKAKKLKLAYETKGKGGKPSKKCKPICNQPESSQEPDGIEPLYEKIPEEWL